MYIVPLFLDIEATEKACSYCVCIAIVALRCNLIVMCSILQLLTLVFGVLGCKYYPMVFLESCFIPYKRHDDIVAIVCYM